MTYQEQFSRIISTALDQKHLKGIVEILRVTAQAVDSCGCVIWETDPWANVRSNPPTGKLYIFARWFKDGIDLPLREMNIDGSANGLAIASGELLTVSNMKTDSRTHKDEYSIKTANLTSMCIVPIKFDAEHFNASLCVYRQGQVEPFSEEEQQFIERVGVLIPALYQATRDKVRRSVLQDLTEIFEGTEQKAKAFNNDAGVISNGLQQVCQKVADTFGCIEVSLFLENRFETEGQFVLMATSFEDWTDEKNFYVPEKDKKHLTGWVLRKARPIRIFDLGHFTEDQRKIWNEYNDQEISWDDSLNIKEVAERILELPNGSWLPPLSFMAVPIIKGEKLLGAIRCCTAKQDPWFFAERQQRILELIARQIGRFWNDWLQHVEEEKDTETWEKFIEEISQLNAKVQKRIDKSEIDEEQLFGQILDLAAKSIKNSDILDIRLFDERTKELYFVKMKGSSNSRLSKRELEQRMKTRFSVKGGSDKHLPLGVQVFKDGVARSIMNAESENYHSKTFPETKRILVAPIGVQKEIIGVLDIRGITNKPFPAHALRLAELLGQQLGLYLSLWYSEKQQRQAFEDLWHQLKSPIRHMFKRANDLVRDMNTKWSAVENPEAEYFEKELLKLRGVSRKAKRVAVNAGVFKDLSSGGKIKISPDKISRLRSEEVHPMIIAAGLDTRLMLEEDEDVKFFANKNGFGELDTHVVKANIDLVEQAVNCLMDNAGKYSFTGTTVFTTGGIESWDGVTFFCVSVRNKGFEITEEEVPELKRRTYRGYWAKTTTGEGSGIGLWVVDHIMQAHSGRLEISATDRNGWNEVKLLFPTSK